MTLSEAVQEAKDRARQYNAVYFVCYHHGGQSPDWRHRYIAARYLGYPAACPQNIKLQVSPDGGLTDRFDNPVTESEVSV